jgi:polyferredoxin
MIAPIVIAPFRGRYWCGNYCPRGSFYDHVLSRFSPRKQIPPLLRTFPFRVFMVLFIMTVFTVQMHAAWGDWNAMGFVFWRLIGITTIVGIVLGFLFHHRAWCSFCPMGTMASWLNKQAKPLIVNQSCVECKVCSHVCPFHLEPFTAKESTAGFTHPDCLKCEACVTKCPKKALSFQ